MTNVLRNSADSPVDFKAKQAEFAAYIRDPEQNPIPADVKQDRMLMYRQLFFNNIEGFLSGNFPVLRQLLDDAEWIALVQDFFAKHRCESPHFSEIPEEFLYYLEHERDTAEDFPFLLELAHYEWVEMALSISNELPLPEPNFIPQDTEQSAGFKVDDLLTKHLKVSPLAWSLAYQYPVHKIGPSHIPLSPPALATFLIVYRNHKDDVNFLEITPMTYRLLEIIQAEEQCLTKACLEQIALESQHPNPEIIVNGGLQILMDLYQKGIVGIER